MPPKPCLEIAVVLETKEVADRTYITSFRSPRIAPAVEPGQFLMVSFPESRDPLLPRAFSVCDADRDIVSLLYVAVGKGTRKISAMKPGEQLMFNGPLGRGFPRLEKGMKVWTAVGGSGAAIVPILMREAARAGAVMSFFYGARTRSQLVHFDDGLRMNHATDDGSEGFHGNVVGMLAEQMRSNKPGLLFGCGPTPMLLAMQKTFGDVIPTFLSVETPMACGMGFCQGCPVRKPAARDYFLACKDGPVFRSGEIEFEAAE